MFFILYINLSKNSDFNLNQGTKLNNDGIIYKSDLRFNFLNPIYYLDKIKIKVYNINIGYIK